MFLNDDFNCRINVVFHLTLFQLMILTSSSQTDSPKDSNRDYFEANDPCREMTENCLDIIVVLNDLSVAWRCSVERSSRDQKFHFHILMQQEALFFM